MKKYFIVLPILFFTVSAIGQDYVTTAGNLGVDGEPGSRLMEKKYIPIIEGSKLLFDDYYAGNIFVKGKAQKNKLNIDLEKKLVFIKFKDSVYELQYNGIDSVVFGNFKIVFKLANLSGCMLVYNAGRNYIIDKKDIKLQESNYNKALDTGRRNNKWIMSDKYYLARLVEDYYVEDKGVIELPSSKNKIALLFTNKDEVLSYIKKHKMRFKEVEDYVSLFSNFSYSLK